MTPSLSRPPTRRAAQALALAAVLAGCAGTAASRERPSTPAHAPRVAVLAGSDATATAIADATSGPQPRTVRRVGGLLEAQAQAAALAAQGYDEVIALGPQARSAVAQARASEVGRATKWRVQGLR